MRVRSSNFSINCNNSKSSSSNSGRACINSRCSNNYNCSNCNASSRGRAPRARTRGWSRRCWYRHQSTATAVTPRSHQRSRTQTAFSERRRQRLSTCCLRGCRVPVDGPITSLPGIKERRRKSGACRWPPSGAMRPRRYRRCTASTSRRTTARRAARAAASSEAGSRRG